MSVRYMNAVIGAAVLMSAPAFAQTTQEQMPASTAGQVAAAGDEMPITLVGCLQREEYYRSAQAAGRGGAAMTGLGLDNEYVLIQASRASSTESIDCTSSTALAGTAYELTGEREPELAPWVGRPVEIRGMLKSADVETQAVGTSGTAGQPTGGFDPPIVSTDLRLHEVNVESVREFTGTAQAQPSASGQVQIESVPEAVGTAGQQEQPGAAAEPDRLPGTASPLGLAGLIGLLSLGGAVGVRLARR